MPSTRAAAEVARLNRRMIRRHSLRLLAIFSYRHAIRVFQQYRDSLTQDQNSFKATS
jgi:hypothetical protein